MTLTEQLGESTAPVQTGILAQFLDAIAEQLQADARRIEALEERITKLEEGSKGLEYRDVWDRSESYVKGDFVTHGGSLWACLRPASPGVSPGSAPTTWRLAVKKGRDGKDAA